MADEVYELGVPKAQVVDAGAYMPASSTLDPDEEDSKPSWAQKWEDDKTKLERLKGLCVTWNKKGGWGFIKRDDGLDDIFVHQRSIHLTGYRSLLIGEQVEFDVQMGSETQKLEAVNVTGPGGIEVKGMFGGEPKGTDDESGDEAPVREKKKPKPKPFTGFVPRKLVKASGAGATRPLAKSKATVGQVAESRGPAPAAVPTQAGTESTASEVSKQDS